LGNRQQFQVIESLLHAAAVAIAATDNAAVVDLRPRSSAVLASPNALIYGIAIGVWRNEPDIRLGRAKHKKDLVLYVLILGLSAVNIFGKQRIPVRTLLINTEIFTAKNKVRVGG